MIERVMLLATNLISDADLIKIEDDLSLNLDQNYFTDQTIELYTLTTSNSEDEYVRAKLPSGIKEITNGKRTFTEDKSIIIHSEKTFTSTSLKTINTFLYAAFGNEIILDADGETVNIRCEKINKDKDKLDPEILRGIYALIRAMLSESTADIYTSMRYLSETKKNFANKHINKNNISINHTS